MRMIKWLCVIFLVLFLTKTGISQQLRLGDNPSSVEKSAVLDLVSTNQGLLLPRISDTTLINALNPPNGMIIYFAPANKLMVRTNGSWQSVISNDNFKLPNLTDVSVSLPQNGQILQYNGSTWVNSSPTYLTAIDTSNIADFSQKVRGLFTGVAPISINANGQISITQAGSGSDGYLSSSDWNTFNNKQPADNYITSLSGDVAATGPGSATATISAGAVTYSKIQNVSASDKVLGRVSSGSGVVEEINTTGTGDVVRADGPALNHPTGIVKADVGLDNVDNTPDTLKPISNATQAALNLKINLSQKGANNGVATLDGGGKVPISQMAVGAQVYKGTWSAASNTPFVSDAVGSAGDTYRVVEGGVIDLGSGPLTLYASDDIIYNGTVWQRNPATSQVTSVNTQSGTVVLTTDDINEGYTNKYYTDAKADLKINVTEKGANNGVATLDAGGKVPASQLPVGAQVYKGTWDASGNSPILADGTGTAGWTYRVTTAGTQNLGSGAITFSIGDDIIYNGTIWQRNPSSVAVSSVNSQTGAVVLTTDEINQGNSNKYYTDSLARHAISASSPLSYNSTNGNLTLSMANTTTSGYLSSTDWNNFNSKQAGGSYISALTGDITASGPGSASATIAPNAVTYSKMQSMTANKLLGSGLTGTAVSEITLGTGLSFTGSTLNAATTGGTVTSFSAGNLSPLFTTSVSNPTTTPALSFSFNSQSQNLLLASPVSSSGTPTFRSLVKADLPLTGVYNDQTNTYTSGSKQIFSASGINADIRLTGNSSDPSTLANGDVWYNSTSHLLKYRANGTTRTFANLDEAQTFTNKTISGSSNTLTNIGNSSLTNSTIGLTLGTSGTDANVSGSPASLGSSLTLNIPTASATNRGLLSAADWNAFNNKLASIDTSSISNFYLKVRSLHSTTVPLTYNSNTGVIGITQANASTSGYLSSTDWNTFNNKLASIDTSNISNFYLKVRSLNSAGSGISYNSSTGVISNSGVLSLNGNTGALTMDTGYINNFYLKSRSLLSAGSGISYNAATGVISSSVSTSNLWNLTGNSGTSAGTNFIGTTDDQDLVFKTNGIETARIVSSTGDIKIGSATTGTLRATKELVLRQDGDTYGPSILRLRNRNAENGAIFETTDPTITLVDFIFKTSANQRNIRYEARSGSAKAGSPSFHIGGSNPDNPTLAIGDSYAAFNTNLKIGNYNTPTEALDITGNLKFSGALMPNNNAGTSGYILTSSGSGSAPTWVNNTLGNLINVSTTSPSSGQLLQYNGTNWVNATPSYLTAIDTSNISNFYLKVRNLNSAGSGISYNNITGVISNSGVLSLNGNTGTLTMDTGYISNFHLKVKSLNSATAPITYNSSTGAIGITQASATTNGYLSSTDWNTFNNSTSSTRTINTTAPLTGGGDLTADRTLSITTNGISNTLIRQSAALSVIGNSTNATANVADITAGTDGYVLRRSGTTLGFGTIATAGITNSAVTYAKIQNVSTNNRLLGRATTGAGVVEEITLGTGLSLTGTTLNVTGSYESPLTFSTGLTRTGNSIANDLSTGIASSNQTVIGSNNASGSLTLSSTSNATKGKILFGAGAYDESSDKLGVGTTSIQQRLTIGGVAQEAISRDIRTGSLEIMGGTSEATGAYFQITGDQNTNSPYEGSAEFVIRNLANSQFGMFSYDGASTWTQRLQLKGQTGDTYLVPNGGKLGVGLTTPSALLHLKAGTATASTAPLKFTAGTNLTTPENGALEYNGTNLFITNGGTRETILTSASGMDTSNISNFYLKVRSLNTVSSPLTYNSSTGLIGISQANTSTNGYLSSTDWNTFNNKVSSNVSTLSSLTSIGTITTGTWNGSIIQSGYGGTGNGYTKFTGPTSSEKTFTLPNASATILTSNAAVTIAQGGTGQTTANAALNALLPSQSGNSGNFLTTDGSNTSWSDPSITNANYVYAYSTSTKTFSSAGSWVDLTFNTAHPQLSGWSHSTSSSAQNFTCNQTGLYQVVYSGQADNTTTSTYELDIRAALDGTEIPGSVSSVQCSNSSPTIANNFLVSINSGQVLKLQMTGSNTAMRLAPGSYGTTKPTITITIIRIK